MRLVRIPFAREAVARYREIYPGEVFPASVVELEDGRVCGSSGSILTAQGELLDEFSVEVGRVTDHPLQHRWKLPPVKRTNKFTTVLSVSKGHNYFHWMTDSLPRIHLLLRAGVDLAELELVVVNALRAPFQRQTLVEFRFRPETFYETHAAMHLQPARMILASDPGIPGDTPAWAFQFLRDTFAAGNAGATRRIYVTRKHAWKRRVRNEARVLAALPGFECVELENLAVKQQASLFQAAECVVAPHGAGLTNLIFCRPGTRVVELFGANYRNPCYERLAKLGHLAYTSLTGPGSLLRGDITVDLAALKRSL